MRTAIMQPTYLPWIGYFSLADQVDTFVFLDDVQFSHQSWQQRNRIKTHAGPQWLTVPVHTKGRRHQRIQEVEIVGEEPWQSDHLKAIRHAYAAAPWFSEYDAWLDRVYGSDWTLLNQLNTSLIADLAECFGLSCSFVRASELRAHGRKAERLVNICRHLGADEYLSPIGSFGYIEENNPFPRSGIRLLYQHHEHPTYHQLHGGFISHLSAVDLLLNEGPRSLEIIRSGQQQPYTHDEVRQLEA